jgi:hypothetical protein
MLERIRIESHSWPILARVIRQSRAPGLVATPDLLPVPALGRPELLVVVGLVEANLIGPTAM